MIKKYTGRPVHLRRSISGKATPPKRFAHLEKWQIYGLFLIGFGALGGVYQLTQVKRHSEKWSQFLDELERSQIVLRIDRDDPRFPGMPYGVDEKGNHRPLHEYMGVFPWKTEQGVVAKRSSAVDLWLIQLAHFTYNHHKIARRDPIWQSVRETWLTSTGVCRDSATVLADMLAESGHDARMVLGEVSGPDWPNGGGGHAWVILIDPTNGNEYLLESAGETQESHMRTPPRVAVKTDYTAQMQVVKRGYYVPEPFAGKSMTRGWEYHEIR